MSRPTLPPGTAKSVRVQARLTPEEHSAWSDLGGADWLRARLRDFLADQRMLAARLEREQERQRAPRS